MSDMYFKSLPDTSTPLIPENLDKLNDIKVSSTEPSTGEKVWIQNTDDDKKIYVKNDDGVYEEFIKNEEDEYTYKKGDTFTNSGGIYFGGTLTGGTKTIVFSIFTPKSLKNITKITLKSIKVTVRDISGTYLLNGVTQEDFNGTISLERRTENCISIYLNATKEYNATNNTPVAVSLDSSEIVFT